MAQYSTISGVKLLIVVLALGFFVYILAPPLYWHFSGGDAGRLGQSCPICVCDCPDDEATATALADFPKNDPDMADELTKSRYQKLQEEMKVQESAATDKQQSLEANLVEAKKSASQYQKEAEKCNSGMEFADGAEKKAEELLSQEKKKSALWEARAKELGWKEEEEKAENREDLEDSTTVVSETRPGARTPKVNERNVPMNKKNKKVVDEFPQNLAVANYIVQRAVDNEIGDLKGARQRAVDNNLL